MWPTCFTANTKEETEHVQFTSVWEEISEFYEQITEQAFDCWGRGGVVWRGFCNARRKVFISVPNLTSLNYGTVMVIELIYDSP